MIKKFALLKCTSSYPAELKNLNLSLILDMKKRFKCEIGYSDHTIGFTAAIGSIHYGASFVEKHVCLNKKIGISVPKKVICIPAAIAARMPKKIT